MEVSVHIALGPEDKRDLARILGSKPAELSAALAPYLEAGAMELTCMFLGKNVFTRGSDILEHRLFLLIRHAFNGRIPDEQRVSALFQTTANGSRSLIRAVMSKYQYQLKAAVDETLKDLLHSAAVQEQSDGVAIAVHSLNLVEELNRELADIDSSLPPVRKKRGSVSTYEIQPSSYIRLCERFGVASKLST